MKTPEEIKKGLACVDCFRCPYFTSVKDPGDCGGQAAKDALAYIEQLEVAISLMKIQMHGDCGCCKNGRDGNMATCNKCLTSKGYHTLWEYEGLPEVLMDDKPV